MDGESFLSILQHGGTKILRIQLADCPSLVVFDQLNLALGISIDVGLPPSFAIAFHCSEDVVRHHCAQSHGHFQLETSGHSVLCACLARRKSKTKTRVLKFLLASLKVSDLTLSSCMWNASVSDNPDIASLRLMEDRGHFIHPVLLNCPIKERGVVELLALWRPRFATATFRFVFAAAVSCGRFNALQRIFELYPIAENDYSKAVDLSDHAKFETPAYGMNVAPKLMQKFSIPDVMIYALLTQQVVAFLFLAKMGLIRFTKDPNLLVELAVASKDIRIIEAVATEEFPWGPQARLVANFYGLLPRGGVPSNFSRSLEACVGALEECIRRCREDDFKAFVEESGGLLRKFRHFWGSPDDVIAVAELLLVRCNHRPRLCTSVLTTFMNSMFTSFSYLSDADLISTTDGIESILCRNNGHRLEWRFSTSQLRRLWRLHASSSESWLFWTVMAGQCDAFRDEFVNLPHAAHGVKIALEICLSVAAQDSSTDSVFQFCIHRGLPRWFCEQLREIDVASQLLSVPDYYAPEVFECLEYNLRLSRADHAVAFVNSKLLAHVVTVWQPFLQDEQSIDQMVVQSCRLLEVGPPESDRIPTHGHWSAHAYAEVERYFWMMFKVLIDVLRLLLYEASHDCPSGVDVGSCLERMQQKLCSSLDSLSSSKLAAACSIEFNAFLACFSGILMEPFSDRRHAEFEPYVHHFSRGDVNVFPGMARLIANTELDELRSLSSFTIRQRMFKSARKRMKEPGCASPMQVGSAVMCVQCHASGAALKCGRCKIARYCSRGCQSLHYPSHRQECKLAASTA